MKKGFCLLLWNACILALGARQQAQQEQQGGLIYLNTSLCNTTTTSRSTNCFANNPEGLYLALNLSSSLSTWQPPRQQQPWQDIPCFPLIQNEMVELLWELPPFPFRCLVGAFYIMYKSDGTQVFAEVTNPIDLLDIAKQCQLSSPALLWGSVIRIVFSADPNSLHHFERSDSLCTLHFPIPGPPYTNLSTDPICEHDNIPLPPNGTLFSLLFRLALPDPPDVNNTQTNLYLSKLASMSKVNIHSLRKNFSCPSPAFGYPKVIPRINVTTEVQDPSVTKTLRYLVDQVMANVMKIVPHATIHLSETFPWISDGFTCINSSMNCQGSTAKCTYMHSNFLNLSTSNFSILVLGCIHHDFVDTSFYSSMSLYKLTSSEKTSGMGISSVVDNEQRSSAQDYIPKEIGLGDHFYVVQFAYSCLPLGRSTLCKTFSLAEIQPNNTLFVVGRTYAHEAGPLPESILNDIVLYVVY